jgi:predicted RNA-binding protein YlxR (DUF448 family)
VSDNPVRMCVGCGGRAPQRDLLRFAVTTDGTLALVSGRQHSGRTGYVHPKPECWERFAARKGPLRSLGRSVDKASRMAFVQELKRNEHFDTIR